MKLRELLPDFCVYKITNLVNGKIYVGKTNNLKKRWREHLRIAKTQELTYYLYSSIKKYGCENFIIKIVEENLYEIDALEREKFWIKNLDSKNPNVGMNLTEGGEGTSGLKWSQESRDKRSGIGNPNFGKPLTNEVKEKLSIALSGENNPFYGKTHSSEVIEFLKNRPISEGQKKISSEGTRGNNHPFSKLTEEKVLEIRKLFSDGISQSEIAKLFGVKRHTINQIVHRKRWTHI